MMHSESKIVHLHSEAFIQDPYRTYRYLRRWRPVYFVDNAGWLISRYEDCVSALSDERLRLPNDWRCITSYGEDLGASVYIMLTSRAQAWTRVIDGAILTLDFAVLTDYLNEICNRHLRSLTNQNGILDANVYAKTVVLTLLRMLFHSGSGLREFARDRLPLEVRPGYAAAQTAMNRLLGTLGRQMNGDLRYRDSLDLWLHLVDKNGELSDSFALSDLLAACIFLVYTAVAEIPALFTNALTSLYLFPQELACARANPEVLTAGFVELARYNPPLQFIAREAITDTGVSGQIIKRGDVVLVGVASANRDQEIFHDANELKLNRVFERRPLTCGLDEPSYSVMLIAPVIVSCLLQSLIRAYPEFTVSLQDAQRIQNHVLRGYETLPVHTGVQFKNPM